MSIKISIYEFFAFTIPGIAYLFLFGYCLMVSGAVAFDFDVLNKLSLVFYLVGVVLAYVLGLLIDRIVKVIWYRWFKPIDRKKDRWIYRLNPRFKFPDTAELVYQEFEESLESKELNFISSDWYGLLVRLHEDNPETASSLERFNASRIMMRNISFALVVFSIFHIALFIQYSTESAYLFLFVLALLFAIIAGLESSKFHRWFYLGIYKAASAYSLNMSKLVRNENDKKNKDKNA